MNDIKIIFCGLSKNCGNTLVKNIEFINKFIKFYNDVDIRSIIVESDSIDGSLEYLKNLQSSSNIELFIENGLEERISSRIERIAICRNIGLDYIKNNFSDLDNVIYIPYDNDIDLFENIRQDNFMSLIENLISNKDIKGIFPISEPFYYDIFALRAKG